MGKLKIQDLILIALEQIEADTTEIRFLTGKESHLSDLEKCKMFMNFITKKKNPLNNRMFYEKFYREQGKADKIRMLEYVSEKIKNVITKTKESKVFDKKNKLQKFQAKKKLE